MSVPCYSPDSDVPANGTLPYSRLVISRQECLLVMESADVKDKSLVLMMPHTTLLSSIVHH